MKIVFLVPYFFPYSSGGTEFYVLQLARGLSSNGSSPLIYVLNADAPAGSYDYQGLEVVVFNRESEVRESLKKLKNNISKSIIHVHSLDGLVDNALFQFVTENFNHVFFTSHLVGGLCINSGTLRYKGLQACDGAVSLSKCQSCISVVFTGKRKVFSSKTFQKVFQKTLLTNIVRNSISDFHLKASFTKKRISLLQNKNVVVFALAKWYELLLRRNKIENVITLPQAVGSEFKSDITRQKRPHTNELRWGFVGRISSEKGIKDLIEIFKACSKANHELYIFYIASGTEFEKKILSEITNDIRIKFFSGITGEQLAESLRYLDCLVIPSKVTEMAPLVLAEARAVQLPVLVSNFIRDDIERLNLGLKFDYFKDGDFQTQFLRMSHLLNTQVFHHNEENVITFEELAIVHLGHYKNALEHCC